MLLPIAALMLAIPAAPPQAQAGQCWFDAMSDADKRELVHGYIEVSRTQGKERAQAWAVEQKTMYARKAAASGACPAAAQSSQQPAAPDADAQLRNRAGKPCKRIELENQNVPNLGGAMGWALIPVCKDD